MSRLLEQCLLLAMSDVSDEEQSDTSDESDIEHILLQLATEFIAAEEKNNVPIGEKRIARYDELEFVRNLSISKQLAESLSEKFTQSSYYQNTKDRGRQSLSAKNQLHVFLWFVSHQNVSYRDVARYFGISLSTVHATLQRIGSFLCDFAPDTIRWPSQQERTITAENYYRKVGIPGIVGCIGTIHIKTDQLKKCNSPRSQCVVLPVQVVCNDENRFVDICIGNEDSDNTGLAAKLNQLNGGEVLVGDTSYPALHNNVIVAAVDGAETQDNNQNLNFCIEQMEVCFTAVKARFRSLNRLKVRNPVLQHLLIKSCFILHNLNYEDELKLAEDHNYTVVMDHSNILKKMDNEH